VRHSLEGYFPGSRVKPTLTKAKQQNLKKRLQGTPGLVQAQTTGNAHHPAATYINAGFPLAQLQLLAAGPHIQGLSAYTQQPIGTDSSVHAPTSTSNSITSDEQHQHVRVKEGSESKLEQGDRAGSTALHSSVLSSLMGGGVKMEGSSMAASIAAAAAAAVKTAMPPRRPRKQARPMTCF